MELPSRRARAGSPKNTQKTAQCYYILLLKSVLCHTTSVPLITSKKKILYLSRFAGIVRSPSQIWILSVSSSCWTNFDSCTVDVKDRGSPLLPAIKTWSYSDSAYFHEVLTLHVLYRRCQNGNCTDNWAILFCTNTGEKHRIKTGCKNLADTCPLTRGY